MNSFFLQGLQHPLLSPSHLIILAALGILIGQQNRPYRFIFSLIATVLIALASTRMYTPNINIEMMLLSIAAIIGILIALKLPLPHWLIFIITLSVAVLISFDSAPVMIPGLRVSKVYAGMVGTWTSISLITLVTSLLAMFINRFWQGIALRVMGSWVFASALMALALLYAPTKTL